MGSNAPGQLLGFSLQYPRALYHLLLCGPGDSVCVEVVGDVATIYQSGDVRTEEDKASIIANPLADKSTNLWKTFYNWIKAVNDKSLDLNKTTFVLYTNKAGRKALIDTFHKVTTQEQATAALKTISSKLKDIDTNHEIWPYYNFVVNENVSVFTSILKSFEFHVLDGSIGFKEVKIELEKKLIPKSQIDFLLENICGWLQQEIMIQISQKKPAIISWEAFKAKFAPLVERIHKRELIDFTLQSLPQKDELENEKKRRPLYIQQLDAIGLSDDEVLEEVANFLRATANRIKWIENEIIDESVAEDFEDRLYRYWENRLKSLKITENHRDKNERGKLLLLDCKSRNETIREMTPPSTTIAGTYHALADMPLLGWHEEWQTSFK